MPKRNSAHYFSLPFNPKLIPFARKLRKARNLPEVLLWLQLKNGTFKGLDFDRQKIIGNYIVDFYCGNCQVVLEIDGSSHNNKQEYDAIRDSYLQHLGLVVIHIQAYDVLNQLGNVMEMLYKHPSFMSPDETSVFTSEE